MMNDIIDDSNNHDDDDDKPLIYVNDDDDKVNNNNKEVGYNHYDEDDRNNDRVEQTVIIQRTKKSPVQKYLERQLRTLRTELKHINASMGNGIKYGFFFFLFFAPIVLSLFGIIVGFKYITNENDCHVPLATFVLISALEMILITTVIYYAMFREKGYLKCWCPCMSLTIVLPLFHMIWLFVGSVWVFGGEPSKKCSRDLYDDALIWMICVWIQAVCVGLMYGSYKYKEKQRYALHI